jgi:hypothetical protein
MQVPSKTKIMRSLLIGRDISISSVTDYELDFDDSVLEYVCELRPPAGLLLISQVIYEHGEPWWNDDDRENILIRPPELSAILPAEPSSSKPAGYG